jgi:hypothetical protein
VVLFGSAGERDDKGRRYHAAFHFHPMWSSVSLDGQPPNGGGAKEEGPRRHLRPSSKGSKKRAGKRRRATAAIGPRRLLETLQL